MLLGVVVALLLVWRCTWFQPSATGVVTDAAGKPVADAYVVAVHWGANYSSLAHATSYACSGELLRTDAAAKYTIPSRLLFTGPLVGELRPLVVATYAADRRTELHTLIQRELERFLAAHGNEERANGQTWSQYAQRS